MKNSSTLFLKIIILLIGIVVFTGLIWFPQTEGRNVNSDAISLYFNDPFLAFVYISSIPFFMALYQGFKLLGLIEKNKAFSENAVKALRTIKYCALSIIGSIILAELYIIFGIEEEDKAGGIALGIFIMLISSVVAAAAAVFEKLFNKAVEIKSENSLIV